MANLESVEDIPMRKFLIKPKDGASNSDLSDIVNDLRGILVNQTDLSIWDYREQISSVTQANVVIQLFFYFTTFIAMLISFFSLMSSMYTNIFEQTKGKQILLYLFFYFYYLLFL